MSYYPVIAVGIGMSLQSPGTGTSPGLGIKRFKIILVISSTTSDFEYYS